MNGRLRSAHDQPLSLEGAKLHLVLEEVDRVVIVVQDLHNAVRGDIDRIETAITEIRSAIREMRQLSTETGEQYSVLLQSARSLMHSIAEKALADSISKAVVVNVYAELTPLLKEEIEEITGSAASVLKEVVSEVAQVRNDFATAIADAIAGKPPLPPVPPEDAPFAVRAKGRLVRCRAKAKRFLVSVTHAVVLVTCLVVLHSLAPSLKLW